MGWSGHYVGILPNRKEECDKIWTSENTEVLKSTMVGSSYYAAVRDKKTGNVWGVVTLTRMDDGYFMTKEMDETVGPFYYDCPLSILNLLSPTDNENANSWRAKCQERGKKKRALKKLAIGTQIGLERHDGHHDLEKISYYGKKLWVEERDWRLVRWPESHILDTDWQVVE